MLVVRTEDNKTFKQIQTPAFEDRVLADGGEVTTLDNTDELLDGVVALNPSLVMVPSGYKASKLYSQVPYSGLGDMTVTRSGDTGMRLNNGYWQPVAANVPRINLTWNEATQMFEQWLQVEELRTNLLPRYKSFVHSDWTKSGVSIEGDPSTAGAELRVSALVNSNYTTFTVVGLDGFDTTSNGSSTHRCGTEDEIVLIENGLYKIEFDEVLNSGIPPTILLVSDFGGTALSSVYTTNNGKNSIYLLSTSNTIGRLQFTNYSSATNYTIRNFTIKKVTGYASPFVDSAGVNLMDGYKLVESATNVGHYMYAIPPVTTGLNYTYSVYVKKYERNFIQLQFAGTTTFASNYANFDINNGVLGQYNGCVPSIEVLSNGWVRCSITALSISTANAAPSVWVVSSANAVRSESYLGDGTSGILIAHAQLEAGEMASSPIGGEEGSTQTRNADVIVKTGASALIGQTEGWVLFESDGSDIELFGLVAKGASKGLFNYDGTNIELYADGELVDSATGTYDWSSMNSVVLGSYANSYLNGRLKVMVLGKTKLTAAVAASLT